VSSTPIADHALLSDCHSPALVDRAGSVDWLVFPRFDSPSVFGRLLDDGAGHWAVRPSAPATVQRRYAEDTMVLETTFRTGTGTLVLRDALALRAHAGGHRLGRGAPHLLVRQLHCTEGRVEVEVDYAPRPEYGLVVPMLAVEDGGAAVVARGGSERLVLSTPVPLELDGGRAYGRVTLDEGDRPAFGLHRSALGEEPGARVWDAGELTAALEETVHGWRVWSAEHQSYDGPWRELVHASGRVLQALTYQPTGAVVAAATTSLPEEVGGERNWDYRYAWVRDATFTVDALWVAACPDEAVDFFGFLAAAAAGSLGRDGALQVVFSVAGERDLTERELPHLAGWRDSRPVRVGNAAWRQRQVDVYGDVLGVAYRLRDQLADTEPGVRHLLADLADVAAQAWREPDHGMWEVRGEPRHFVQSKVLCWVALDRAIELAELLEAGEERVAGWRRARDEVHEAVLREGWDPEGRAFVQAFGGTELDAGALMLPIVGFLPADDPRVLATVEAVERRLVDEQGLVRRYDRPGSTDGVAGDEGAFLLCTFWLAHALALAGEVDRAREVFERAAKRLTDVGLLAEEVDPRTGELLGNVPQAFSHIGLVNAAWAVAEAERGGAGPTGD
jgi:GH15 family glucan-1,4-alpha-glucosidase